MNWFACELHTHTVHSDGSQTLHELAAGAAKLGFDAIALTDHNTMSGFGDAVEVRRESGVSIIPGMEWTTFYGHMVTLGPEAYVDWREADKNRIDQGIAAVHRSGGLAGLAHPFRIGSPACTGCFWEYEIRDWSAVDYIEVWSGTFAPIQTNNQRAFALWTDKLNEGYRIAATSGRDWHAQADTDEPISVTYLGVPKGAASAEADGKPAALEAQLVQALREGRASVTIGPLLTLTLELDGESFGIGSVIPRDKGLCAENIQSQVSIDFTVRAGLWTLPDRAFKLILRSDRGIEAASVGRDNAELDPYRPELCSYRLNVSGGARKWLRAELWGSVRGAHILIAFTNAIYFD